MLGEISRAGIMVEEALTLNQLTFGSLCYQKWVVYTLPAQRFVKSKLGLHMEHVFTHISPIRQHNTGKFSKRVHVRRWKDNVVSMRKKVA